eukprot:scaffold15998_cov111-Isochrysis_galbana.AAC.6
MRAAQRGVCSRREQAARPPPRHRPRLTVSSPRTAPAHGPRQSKAGRRSGGGRRAHPSTQRHARTSRTGSYHWSRAGAAPCARRGSAPSRRSRASWARAAPAPFLSTLRRAPRTSRTATPPSRKSACALRGRQSCRTGARVPILEAAAASRAQCLGAVRARALRNHVGDGRSAHVEAAPRWRWEVSTCGSRTSAPDSSGHSLLAILPLETCGGERPCATLQGRSAHLSRALGVLALAPIAPPCPRVAESLVPAERSDGVKEARACLTHKLAVCIHLGWARPPILEAAAAGGAQRLRAVWPRPLRRWTPEHLECRYQRLGGDPRLCFTPLPSRAEAASHTLPEHSECLQLHHEQRHEPLSQKRRCPPRAPMVEKVRLQLGQIKLPSASLSGMLVWPAL